MNLSSGPFITREPLDPEFHDTIITRRDLPQGLVARIAANEYCLLLGPHKSGRTTTLHLVRHALAQEGNRVPVYINPRVLDLTDEAGFLQSLADCIRVEIESLGYKGLLPPRSFENAATEGFIHFLRELTRSGLRPVILFDALEAVPPNVFSKLLNVTDALFTTRNDAERRHQRNLVFVFAGNLPLSYLTGSSKPELSPFSICSNVVVRDLTPPEALQFLNDVNRQYGLRFRFDALQAILEYAGGDLNILQRVGEATLELAAGGEVGREWVEAAVSHLLAAATAGDDQSLRHVVLEIEEDPATFDLVVGMLRGENPAYHPGRFSNELLHDSSFTYPEMTGALTLLRSAGEPVQWSFRNLFMRKLLDAHFTPARVVRTYTALGMFDHAVARCNPLLEEIQRKFVQVTGVFDDQYLNDVIIAITNRIYASRSHESAYELIALLLTKAFGCNGITYYFYRSDNESLHAVSFLGDLFENDGSVLSLNSPNDQGTLEARAYRSRMLAIASRPKLRAVFPIENLRGEVTAVISLTPQMLHDHGVHLTARMQVVQRALRSVNFALDRVEHFNKERIIESASHLAGSAQTTNVFVAHKFTDELLANLQGQLGQVNSAFSFLFANTLENVGLLHQAIHEDMRKARLGLYEMSHPNNNVYYELGFGIGINLPGVMFIRKPGNRREMVPPLLAGILYLEYGDYTGLIEGVARRLEEVLRRYVLRRQERYLHFVQCEIPRSSRKWTRYAVVLEHDHFGEANDYRRHIAAGLAAHGLEPVFVLDEETDARHLVKGHTWGKRLLDLYVLVKHANLVICRCEEVTESVDAAQVFLGLGIAHGLERPVLLTRWVKDFSGAELEVPDDLRGISRINYVGYAELQQQIAKARIDGQPRPRKKKKGGEKPPPDAISSADPDIKGSRPRAGG